MKIFLCDLVNNQSDGTNQISGGQDFVVPLNVASLASYVKEQLKNPLEISIFKYPKDLLDELNRNTPDIVGFSSYIWNKDINIKIASFVRKKYPGVFFCVAIHKPGNLSIPTIIGYSKYVHATALQD